MATRRIKEFLDGNHVRYVIVSHSPAYTASQVAHSIHIPGRSLAKSVIVVVGGRLAIAVVPADKEVDMAALREATSTEQVHLADETEFANRFEGCQLGTVPPFGNLFGVDTFVDQSLAERAHITFNAGTHTDVITIDMKDYLRLVGPVLVRISTEPFSTKFYVDQL